MLSIIQDYKSYLDLDLDRERFLLRDLDLLLRLRERDRPLLSSINLILRPFNSLPSSLSIAFFKSCVRTMKVRLGTCGWYIVLLRNNQPLWWPWTYLNLLLCMQIPQLLHFSSSYVRQHRLHLLPGACNPSSPNSIK